MNTLLLDPDTWDLTINAAGNIATASLDAPVDADRRAAYALAQDAASAIRTFKGECWYNTTVGVPYWEQILGKTPPLALLKQRFVEAALTVPGVVSAKCFLTYDRVNRTVGGQVQVSDSSGQTAAAAF